MKNILLFVLLALAAFFLWPFMPLGVKTEAAGFTLMIEQSARLFWANLGNWIHANPGEAFVAGIVAGLIIFAIGIWQGFKKR